MIETDDAHGRMMHLFHTKEGVEKAVLEKLGRLFYLDVNYPQPPITVELDSVDPRADLAGRSSGI